MSGQVILDFEDQADALRFALAAGSVMAGDDARATDNLVQETIPRQPHPPGRHERGEKNRAKAGSRVVRTGS